ncbi:MAG: YfiR family protein [Candidatus Berkiellales bacterium]
MKKYFNMLDLFLNRFLNRCVRTCVIICTIACPALTQGQSQPAASNQAATAPSEYSAVSREYHLKAAFLRYVAQYIEWPSESLQVGSINICVIGQVPYFEGINSINGKVVNERVLVISKLLDAKDAKGHCQILFVAKTEEDKSKQIINTLQDLPVLTFGDMDHFSENGGDMNFYIANNRLAIMTNLPVIDKAKLKINPEMLRLVTVVPKTT